MRKIAAVTVGRSDWGILRPVLHRIKQDNDLELELIVAGGHWHEASGNTWREVESDGFEIRERVEMNLSSDSPAAIAKSMGLGVLGFTESFVRTDPDMILLLGDRFEMMSAAMAAVPLQLPIAHIHGGEVTYGAIDESFRHAITKCSHLHFASTASHADRIAQMGEEDWRITVSGAPGLDNLAAIDWATREELEARIGLSLDQAPVVVTYHPATLQCESVETQVVEFVAAMERIDGPIITTHPNADTNATTIGRALSDFCASRHDAVFVHNLGTRFYFSLLRYATVMVGNSSSGIVEAASFEVPVVNVGLRQAGRMRSKNVIDVSTERSAIAAAVEQARSSKFRESLRGMKNCYGDGEAAGRIVSVLKRVPIDEKLRIKRFVDRTSTASEQGDRTSLLAHDVEAA